MTQEALRDYIADLSASAEQCAHDDDADLRSSEQIDKFAASLAEQQCKPDQDHRAEEVGEAQFGAAMRS
jgi:hypothetical protein